jgi:hypothetical protein
VKDATLPLVVNEPEAVGFALNVTFIGLDVPTPSQAIAFVVVTVTLLVDAVRVIVCVVSPVDQR